MATSDGSPVRQPATTQAAGETAKKMNPMPMIVPPTLSAIKPAPAMPATVPSHFSAVGIRNNSV